MKILLQSDAGPKARAPHVLLVCPPAVGEFQQNDREEKFPNAAARSKRLPDYYKTIAALHGCAYLNSQDVVTPSLVDDLHLAAGEHEKLGKAMAVAVKRALA